MTESGAGKPGGRFYGDPFPEAVNPVDVFLGEYGTATQAATTRFRRLTFPLMRPDRGDARGPRP